MDMDQYIDVFIDESFENLESLTNQLLLLEKDPSNREVIDQIFRAAHTIKGMSATMGFQQIADLTHHMENLLDEIREQKIQVNENLIDLLFQTVQTLERMVQYISQGKDSEHDIGELLHLLESSYSGGEEVSGKNYEENGELNQFITRVNEYEKTILQESLKQGYSNYELKITLDADSLLKGVRAFMVFETLEEIGEIIKSKPPVSDLEEERFDLDFSILFVSTKPENEITERLYNISEIEKVQIKEYQFRAQPKKSKKEISPESSEDLKEGDMNVSNLSFGQTIRVNLERLDLLMNLIEELVIEQSRLEELTMNIGNRDMSVTVENFSRIANDLQDITLGLRMVPIRTVFNRFPGMVRQVSRELGKKINLQMIGEETELDRTVIDEIGDPLVHLIRNAIDHGIESPEERKAAGKDEEGMIRLEAYQSGHFIFIEILDDGMGIDRASVLKQAVDKDLIQKEQIELLTDEQVYELIMESGFSTSKEISDLSGRGVGLDVVKSTIETLGGNISIQSELHKGTKFSIQLPLTLSILSVLLIGLQEEKYAIPLSSVEETIRINPEDMIDVHQNKMIDYRGKVISLIFLKDYLSVTDEVEIGEQLLVVVIRSGDQLAGLVVDELIHQQEIVIKPLGEYLKGVPAISGATILGDGNVALILDTNHLIRT